MSNLPSAVTVAIIGAGPAGLMSANLLGRLGVDVLLIERNAAPYDVPRAITLDDEGSRTMQAAGLDREYLPNALPGRGSRYYDDDGIPFAEVGPGPTEYGFPRRTQIFQPAFERVLLGGLDRFEHVRAAYSHHFESLEAGEDGARVTVSGPDGEMHTILADYVLGADGARSPVRRALGIEMLGDTYPEDWLIVDTLNDPDQEPVSKFFCRSDRPFVSIPAPSGGRRYEWRAAPGETTETLLDPARIRALLEPIRRFEDSDIQRAVVYSFESRIAEHWSKGRVFLLGDAAHLTPPFAGQGMNAGLRDAHNLSWKIWATATGKAGPGLLETYEAERRGPAWAMVQLAVAMGDIVMPQGERDIAFRTSLVAWMDRFPAARDFIVQMKFKPPPRYDTGAFVDLDNQPFTGSLVGQMMPQPPMRALDGTEIRLDDVIGPGFALIAQQEATARFIADTRDSLWPELAPSLVAIGEDMPSDLDGVTTLVPEANPAMAALRSHRDQIILIRPDRYVAAAFWPSDIDAVDAFRAAMGNPPPPR
jgi:3-(3-hydroxy-phenyl)propionate hydroxylase